MLKKLLGYLIRIAREEHKPERAFELRWVPNDEPVETDAV